MLFDLHTHSGWSDGELIPAELVQRARDKGYTGIAITDHADSSNLDLIITNLRKFERSAAAGWKDIKVITGVELTHVPPGQIPGMIKQARELGAGIVVVHGETPVEPVEPGTNHAAISGGADCLAHPGMISDADMRLAAKKNVFIEITRRQGHNICNGRVANLAKKYRAPFVFNTDTHTPSDLFTGQMLTRVALGAGFSKAELTQGQKRAEKLISERIKRLKA